MARNAKTRLTRRRLLGHSLLLASSVTAFGRVFGQTRHGGLAAMPLADDLVAIRGAGANVVVLVAPDGLLVIDGGAAERSDALLDYLAQRWPGLPVLTLFNTNWWWEHTGSNSSFAEAGATIIAHENTKRWLAADFKVEWQDDRAHEPLPSGALPTQTVAEAGQLPFGDSIVEYGHFANARTDGDLYVSFPDRNVVVVSDLLSVGHYPIPDYSTGGSLTGMRRAAEGLLAIADDDTKLVPATGPVQRRPDLARFHEMCATLEARITALIDRGLTLEEILAERPTRDYDGRWGDPELFLTTAYKSLADRARERREVL
jgi:cyclase